MSLRITESQYEKILKRHDKQLGKIDKLVTDSRIKEKTNKSKFGNVLTSYNGKTFDSKREAERYQELKLLERAGEITALMTQVPFLIEPANRKNRAVKYRADFVYLDCRTNKWVVEDAKGFKTSVYKIKKKSMFNRYGIEIQEV